MFKTWTIPVIGLAALVCTVPAAGQTARLTQSLLKASEKGDAIQVKTLLESGVDVNGTDNSRRTPLHLAADKQRAAVIKTLIEFGGDRLVVNARDDKQRTPLYYAADRGNVEIVSLLVAAGADPYAMDERGRTALDIQQGKKGRESVRELLSIGLAARQGNLAAVELQLEGGWDPNRRNANGYTPLMLAAAAGHANVVQRLLDAGAEVDAQSPVVLLVDEFAVEQQGRYAFDVEKRNLGPTAVVLAGRNGHSDVVAVLLESGANRTLEYVCKDVVFDRDVGINGNWWNGRTNAVDWGGGHAFSAEPVAAARLKVSHWLPPTKEERCIVSAALPK